MNPRRLNVLVFASTFPRWFDDPVTARFILDLSFELKKYFNTFVLTPHAPNSQFEEDWDGLRIIRYPYFYPTSSQALVNGTGMLSCLKQNRLAAFQIPFFLMSQLRALKKTVKQFKIDVVNSHWMIPQGFTGSLRKSSLGFKHILTIHAAGLFALRRIPFGRQMAKTIVRNTDTIYSVSEYNHSMLNDLLGEKISARILPMGIHTKFFEESKDRSAVRKDLRLGPGKALLYVGKLSEKKGVTYLLNAFADVQNVFEEAQLIIVGGGLLEQELKNQAQALNLKSCIRFAGFQDKEMIKKYFQACDLVVIPSIIDSKGETEGMPVVLLEALASSKPVVATNVGGMPDILDDGRNGFIVQPKNSKALSEKILKVFNSETKSFENEARKTAIKYDWTQIGLDYRESIKNLLKG